MRIKRKMKLWKKIMIVGVIILGILSLMIIKEDRNNLQKPLSDIPNCNFPNFAKDNFISGILDQKFENEEYSYSIGSQWRNQYLEVKSEFPGESYYSLDGKLYPPFYKDGPLMIKVWSITEKDTNSIEEDVNDWIKGIYSNKDRDFSNAPKVILCKNKLASGNEAYFIKSNYYSISKGLSNSRYDVLSSKERKTYTITVTVEYITNFEKTEEELRLDHISYAILSSLELKSDVESDLNPFHKEYTI